MIRAHLATYPIRREILERAVRSIAAQVDCVYIVLNEYTEVPRELSTIDNIETIIPDEDFKDVGKFVLTPAADDIVCFVDDDLIYASDYVERLLRAGETIDLSKAVIGYHGSIYKDIDSKGANGRRTFSVHRDLEKSFRVDQLATNSMLALGVNVPPLDFMRGSQQFVDVRYASWLYQRGIASYCIQHGEDVTQPMRVSGRHETIYKNFTRNSPTHVIEEIRSFAGKGSEIGSSLILDLDT